MDHNEPNPTRRNNQMSLAALAEEPAPTDNRGRVLFTDAMGGLQRWRDDLAEVITEYQSWSERQNGSSDRQNLATEELIQTLRGDKLVIAAMGEYSRGKTELLNAIFFADHGVRLMPSAAGRTTMCPAELRYDEKTVPCVRLLPIETRKTTLTLAEYKRTPAHWVVLHILKPGVPSEWRDAFQELTRTKAVDALEAWELGLLSQDPRHSAQPSMDRVEIPVWRHAIINYPHPLLRQGLVVLDTPGLNALGAEPELTLAMLPDAHALLFLLAADAGVTRTDLELWNRCDSGTTQPNRRIVALNKVDILWDELRDPALVERTIDQQVSDTARTLEIDPRNVLPVSAQKGLAAKIKRDWVLLEKSGLLAVERKLTDEVIPARHLILQDYIVREMSGRIENSRGLIESRLATHVQQLAELRGLTGKNIDTIEQMVAHIRIEKHTYDRAVEGFEKTRAALAKQAATLLGYLNADRLDEFIRQTHMDMNESWTTAGLKHSMDQFFQEVHLRIEQAGHEADRIKQVVEAIYERLHQECGLPKLHPAMLSLLPFVVKATNLERKAEAFRNSPGMVMTERHFVVRKFFITLVGQARQTFRECDTASKRWFHDIISPLFMHIQQHRVAINSRLTELKQIHADVTSLNERIRVLETRTLQIEDERRVMDSLLERLHRPLT